MGLIRHLLTSFNGGELSPRMMGRTDTAVYAIGLEVCENFCPTVEGPIVKMPGFEYICAADSSSTWLGEFGFNLTQDYVIEWGEEKARFFTNGGRIETSPGVAYEVTTPYAAADAPRLSFQQSFDRLYLAHGSYPYASLTRTSAVTFAHANVTVKNGPFLDQNTDPAITVTSSAVSGSVTIAASSAIFLAGHVGGLFRIEALDFSDVTAWEAGMKAITIGMKVRSDGKVYEAATAGVTGSVQPIHTEGSAWDGANKQDELNTKGPFGIKWAYVSDDFGIVEIASIGGGGTTATGTVLRRLPDSVMTVATYRWAHGAFSTANGWPNLVSIWNSRAILIKDFDVHGSVVGDYGGGQVNFAAKASSGQLAPDMAFRRTLATEDPPLWIAGDRKLIVGTASRELAVGPLNNQAALSGTNISAEPQSFYGSAAVFPVQIATSTIFAQRGGRKLREVGYDFARDRYIASNMVVWARHITKSGVIQFAFQKEPEELLFCVRADGVLAVHPHAPEQEVKGFARRTIAGGGKVLSAVCITDEDGVNDEVWALIERNGAKSIQRMAKWRDDGDPIADAFFVDFGVTTMASAGQTHFTGLTHLANETVAVLANGAHIPDVAVDGTGAFDLPATAVPHVPYRMTVGLPYTARCVTLRPPLSMNGQPTQGLRHRLVRLAVRLLETAGVRIGAAGGTLDNLIDRRASDAMDAPVPLFTGDTGKAVGGGWDREGRAEFISDTPLPATIIALMPKVEIGDDG
jgi:hypothetical protein